MNKFLKYSLTSLLSIQALYAQATVTPFAEFLYWHASEQPASTWANSITEESFKAENNNFGWSPGFRGGIAYKPESFFESRLYWTYFSTESSDTIPLGDQVITPEFFSGFLSTNFFFGATSNWNLTMNMIDLDISHPFQVASNISIRPLIGIKGGTINQTIDTVWEADYYNATEKITNDFTGIGPTFGISGQWNMTHEWQFLANFTAAFLWGNWNISDVYTRPYEHYSLTPEATEITTDINDSALGTTVLTYFVGIQWAPKVLSRATFLLGYEMQYWPNQLRLPTFQELPTHGDLTLQGGTCGIAIDF